jgi:hypothetical protein
MVGYKRNQIEEAISRVLEPTSAKPSSELRTRIKRLLETDRGLDPKLNATGPEYGRFAFFSENSPGSGKEVWFSEYEAFALLVGLLLMGHGWPQSFAVSVLRRVRPDLEAEHSRTLSQDASSLFDQEAIRRKARPGDMVFDNLDPVLLTIVSRRGPTVGDQSELYACGVRRGLAEATKFVQQFQGETVGGSTWFELVNAAHHLSRVLAETKPRQRGRS